MMLAAYLLCLGTIFYVLLCIINVNYYGNDVDMLGYVSSWQDCGEICLHDSVCGFWTWVEAAQQCYLKTSDEGLEKQHGQYSGVRGCK